MKEKGSLTPRTLVFAAQKESDESESGSSQSCIEDQMHMAPEHNDGSRDPDVEVASITLSEADLSQSAVQLGNQGNLLDKLKAVHLHILAMEQWNASRIKLCHRNYMASATNLIHYLALKCLDVEQLKEDLSSVGLLNLETINPCVIANLTAGIQMLENLKSYPLNIKENACGEISNKKNERTAHIMVTVGQEVTENETLITDILKSGATIIRINCAHGNPSIWSEIIRRVRRSSQMLEKPCRILMDLAGPKLRTGNMKAGPCVIKISPKKNACGDIMLPAQLGDTVRFRDARGKKRTLKICKKFPVFAGTAFMAECNRTAYVQSGTGLYIKGQKHKSSVGEVVDVPAVEQFVRLRVGDLLIISLDSSIEQDELTQPTVDAYRVTCPSSFLFDSVKPGEPIAFDDGKIWGVIQGTSASEIIVSITHASPRGTKLGAEKSINIPESNIRFEGLTTKDLMDLEFVAAHADMVGISFIRDVRDIVVLRAELEKRKLHNLGIVLKIETSSGGDLAVECGWERLGDIQEEILSICSAAHVPVIWATQVLESLVKSGVPTRAELTDVANGRRASCIMLNKGKHIVDAVSTLDIILQGKSTKMKAELKPLATLPLRHVSQRNIHPTPCTTPRTTLATRHLTHPSPHLPQLLAGSKLKPLDHPPYPSQAPQHFPPPMVKLASARESRLYGTRLARKRFEYINAGLYVFATIVLLSGFVSQLSRDPKSGLALMMIGLGLLFVVNVHDLVAHMAGIDYRLGLMEFDLQLGLVEFSVPFVQAMGYLLSFLGILFLFLQEEKGYGYFKLERHALNMLIAGPVLWVLGSIHNSCQIYERADGHIQILQQSVHIPFLMGSLLFMVGSIINCHEQARLVHHGYGLGVVRHVWVATVLHWGPNERGEVFKMQQMDGLRLEKLRGGAQERLIHEREGQIPLILEDQRRRKIHVEEAMPVVVPTPYRDVLVGHS
ncbi:Plastidial pyruvate kinase 4, chloroplastic [Vitis vinifera]|uniref:Plastidial pyruvate kinase 4, chloroplastic n=1 Tax=Vitis vinifera TaxID=29760 RepID=A0A438GJ93_VITVI|nr:Plastidial pyruvate kinase 4, chloroplastic [Vitis vinifera]